MEDRQEEPPPLTEVFEAAWRNHSAAVLGYAARRTRTPQDAAEVLADTFLVAWRRVGDMPAEAEALPWLYAVARRVLANQRRSERRRAAATESLRQAARVVADNLRPPSDDPRAEALAAAMARLTESDRELLRLAAWEGLAPAQIATVLGCSPAAARVRLHRARRRLAAQIGTPARKPEPEPEPLLRNSMSPQLEVPL